MVALQLPQELMAVPANRRILIIGAGIVGSTLSHLLATRLADTPYRLFLLDRDVTGLPGSTGHAPGFVGQLNELSALTELAKRSVRQYRDIPGGWRAVGGLEVAVEQEDEEVLRRRRDLAEAVGLPAEVISRETASQLAPIWIDGAGERDLAVLHFPEDGTADARVISLHEQTKAAELGCIALDANVLAISPTPNGHAVETSLGTIHAGQVILCTGIWASTLLPSLEHTVVSVAHPYTYSAPHTPRPSSPWIRWPSQHVYARDHGTRDGLGAYNHAPKLVTRGEVKEGRTAFGGWEATWEGALDKAYSLVHEKTRSGFDISGGLAASENPTSEDGKPIRFNGIFSVTPDGLPLVGEVQGQAAGLWCAVACWVTHAAGCADVLADMVTEKLGVQAESDGGDDWLRKALDPMRFAADLDGGKEKDLERMSLSKYNDIYNREGK
jgi:sarcosine oxidase